MTLRISTLPQEGVYQGSKFLKYQVLCEVEELARLIDGSFWMYPLTALGSGEPMEKEVFLSAYAEWIERLKKGEIPSSASLRKVLASAWTLDKEALWKQEVEGSRYLIKMGQPVVQVQAHFFTYSSLDGVFRPMTLGEKAIFWGLQFSFPQIYQEPKTLSFLETDETPNRALFDRIKQWVRDETRPTPFVVEEKKTNVPIRLGKGCFSWIAAHPQLKEQGIKVYG